jgi:hypothetical protein
MCQEVDIGHEHLQFYYRDTLQCIRLLYGDPDFLQHLAFTPEQHYTAHDRTCRILSEMYTGDWWWSKQVRTIKFSKNQCLQLVPGIH